MSACVSKQLQLSHSVFYCCFCLLQQIERKFFFFNRHSRGSFRLHTGIVKGNNIEDRKQQNAFVFSGKLRKYLPEATHSLENQIEIETILLALQDFIWELIFSIYSTHNNRVVCMCYVYKQLIHSFGPDPITELNCSTEVSFGPVFLSI